MRMVEFDTVGGSQVTIFFTGNLTVQRYTDRDGVCEVCVMDGLHNNGGWKVKGTYQEVVKKIKLAIGYGKVMGV